MRGIFLFILVCSISIQSIGQQSFVDYFDLPHLLMDSLQIESCLNLDPFKNVPLNTQKQTECTFSPRKIKLDSVAPFLSFSAAWLEHVGYPDQSELSIRFSTTGLDWDPWQTLRLEDHYEGGRFTAVSTLMELEKSIKYYQLKFRSNLLFRGTSIRTIQLNFFNPGHTQKNQTVPGLSFVPRSNPSCACMRPTFVSRSGWHCPQGAWPVTFALPVTHLIVHHSAGQNNSIDWAATVLSIWNFHVSSNGYSDIGYNWLIAPDGTLFEGRYSDGADVLGAHFCSKNSNTMGVCILGTYTDQSASTKALNTLTQLLAWKSCELNIDPTERAPHISSGLNLLRISGHRDGCPTECPGEKVYDDLPILRTTIADMITSACQATDIALHQDRSPLLLSPNPTTGWITLTLNTLAPPTIQYQLYNSQGQSIFKAKNLLSNSSKTSCILDLTGYPTGLYHLIVQQGNNFIHRKILKL